MSVKDITHEVADLLQGKRVLVVDDQKLSRHIVVRFFTGAGPEPIQAKDGAEGLAALTDAALEVGAVVADFNMPMVNGLQLLKSIRTGFGGIRNDLPVIMLTGNNDGRLVGAALALDVDAFILKPVSKNVLMARMRKVLSTQRTVKSPQECAAIDIESAIENINSVAEEQTVKPGDIPLPPPKGREVPLESVQVPTTLAQDIRAPTGELLLASGVTLTRRLIDRLIELNGLGIPLKTVWVL